MLLLLGRCGLERLAEPLRALGHEVQVAAWTQTELVAATEPELVYVDLFDWDALAPLVAAALAGEPPCPDLAPLRAVVDVLRDAPVVYRGLRPPPAGAFGLLEGASERALRAACAELASVVRGERVLDVAALWARLGVVDDQVPHGLGHGEASAGAAHEARWLDALWQAKTRGPLKCLVVDLDETLIHGRLVADDFAERNPAYLPEGEAPRGSALDGIWRLRRGLHEALRVVRARGIVLALATRNDPTVLATRFRKRPPEPSGAGAYAALYEGLSADARASSFASHPRLLDALALGAEDFVAVEAGFGPKSEMLTRIAGHLGIATAALGFLDDSPYERAEVAHALPEVSVLEGDWAEVREQLLLGAPFQVWGESPAAGAREASYRSRGELVAREGKASLEDFLRGLELRVGVRPALAADLPRVRELLQRTHQLDLTGRRPEVTSPAGVYVGWCRDRIADHGLVAVGVFREGTLEAWVCSCRVLPHRVASTLLREMLAREPGARVERTPTARNAATLGLIEAAQTPAPWVEVEA